MFGLIRSDGSKGSSKKSRATASAALITGLSIVKESVDGVPAPGLKGAVGGLLKVLEIIKKTSENVDELSDLSAHLNDLSELLSIVKGKHETEFAKDLDERIAKLTSDIERIVESCGHLRSQTYTRRLVTAQDDASELSRINKAIERAIQTFQLGGNISIAQGVAEIRHHLKRLPVHQAPQDRNDPLNVLRSYTADARFDSASRRYVSRCFEGTRSELLQGIYDWAENPDAKAIYWLCGLAGTGKSTIAQTLAEAFNRRKILGASFFFSRDVAERSNVHVVFTTIAYQLSQFHETFLTRISAFVRKYPDACSSMLETQMEKLIIEPLRDVAEHPQLVVLVIDALDECADESLVQEMLILLTYAIHELPFHLKIFITSRPDVHIRSKFHEAVMKSVSEASLLHDIDLSIVQHDIGLYLGHHLRRVGREMLMDSTWPTQADIDVLVERARGLFIYASALIAYIGDKGYRRPKQRLHILLEDKRESGGSPYAEVDRLYRHILQSTLPLVGAWSIARQLQPILATIITLLDPLPVESMEKLISAEEGSVLPMLSPLHSVLSISDNPMEPIRIFHKSFPDFMCDQDRCTDSRLLVKSDLHHSQLALHCLNVLNTNLRRNMCQVRDEFVMNDDISDLDTRLEHKAARHVLYACKFWAVHLKNADPANTELRNAVQLFASTKLLNWLEILSLLKRIDVAIASLEAASDWYEVPVPGTMTSNRRKAFSALVSLITTGDQLQPIDSKLLGQGSHVKELFSDCRGLILHFLGPITRSACYIYHSALPFAPDCVLYRQFANKNQEMRHSIKVLSERDSTWDPMLTTLNEHTEEIRSLQFSPDGVRIASGSADSIVSLWDATSGTHIRTLRGHFSSVNSVCFSPDGLKLVSGSDDATIRVWDITSGNTIKTFHILQMSVAKIVAVAFSPDGTKIVGGSSGGLLPIWNWTTAEPMQSLTEIRNHGAIPSVCFSPDGTQIAFGTLHGSICLWDVNKRLLISKHPVWYNSKHPAWYYRPVYSICFSPSGSTIAFGGSDGQVCLLNLRQESAHRTLGKHSSTVWCVSFSHDGLRIASASSDSSICLWDCASGTQLRVLTGHSGPVYSVCYSPDGSRVASGGSDCTIRLWDSSSTSTSPRSRVRSLTRKCHHHEVTSIRIAVLDRQIQIYSRDISGFGFLWKCIPVKGITRQDTGYEVPPQFGDAYQDNHGRATMSKHHDSNITLDQQSLIYYKPHAIPRVGYTIAILPYPDITCFQYSSNFLAIGTRDGSVHFLDISGPVAKVEQYHRESMH